MFVATPRMRNSATARRARRDRVGEVAAAAGELDQHRVEVRADLGTGVDGAAVEPDAGAARRAVGADRAGVRAEAVGRVLGGDPALQRGAAQRDVVLGQAEVGQRLARRRCAAARCTRSTSVTSSVTVCSTWMRGFISMKTWLPRSSSRNSTVPALT